MQVRLISVQSRGLLTVVFLTFFAKFALATPGDQLLLRDTKNALISKTSAETAVVNLQGRLPCSAISTPEPNRELHSYSLKDSQITYEELFTKYNCKNTNIDPNIRSKLESLFQPFLNLREKLETKIQPDFDGSIESDRQSKISPNQLNFVRLAEENVPEWLKREWQFQDIATGRSFLGVSPELPDWIFKFHGNNPKGDVNPMATALRVPMAHKINRIIQSEGLDMITVPRKCLVDLLPKTITDKLSQQELGRAFAVMAEKVDFVDDSEKIRRLLAMSTDQQRRLATQLATVISQSGLMDVGLQNLKMTKDGKIVLIDTEPLFHELEIAEDLPYSKWKRAHRDSDLNPRTLPLPEAAAGGLSVLLRDSLRYPELSDFNRVLEEVGEVQNKLSSTFKATRKEHASIVTASKAGNIQFVIDYINQRHDLNLVNRTGETPLLASIKGGHKDVTHLLLNHHPKVDLNLADDLGCTPLAEAAEKGDLQLVKLLLSMGAHVNGDPNGSSPIERAIFGRNLETVGFFLSNYEIPKHVGPDLLMVASLRECRECMQLLLKKGVSPHEKNKNGITALEMITNLGDTESLEMLKRYDSSFAEKSK